MKICSFVADRAMSTLRVSAKPMLCAALLAACWFATGIARAAESSNKPGDFQKADVLAAFSLIHGDLQTINTRYELGVPVALTAVLDNQPVTIELKPYSVRGMQYRVQHQVAGGKLVDVPAQPERTYRGMVVEWADSQVAGSLLRQGLFARVIRADGEELWIEPVAKRVPSAPPGLHVVYRRDDVMPTDAMCSEGEPIDSSDLVFPPHLNAHDHDASEGAADSPSDFPVAETAAGGVPSLPVFSQRGGCDDNAPCITGTCQAELAVDVDSAYWLARGEETESYIESVVNVVNMQYEDDLDSRHAMVYLLIRTDPESDPYDGISTATVLKSQFQVQWQSFFTDVDRDLAMLVTGQEMLSGFIGAANTGTICEPTTNGAAYTALELDYNGNFQFGTDLCAHELGHIWGAGHCACHNTSTGDYTMNAAITGANRFHPSFTLPGLELSRDSATCLDPYSGPENLSTPLPFFDSFPSPFLNTNKWTRIVGAKASSNYPQPPSPPYALELSGNRLGGDSIMTQRIDTSGVQNELRIRFEFGHTGNLDAPEPNTDGFTVEFLRDNGNWTVLFPSPIFLFPDFIEVPSSIFPQQGGMHENFRLRIVTDSDESCLDDWFFDNISIYDADVESCFDGILNGDETRADCGGSCRPCQCTTDSFCSNNNPCNGEEYCDTYGFCRLGTPPVCDDGDPCTEDTCVPNQGCQFTSTDCDTGACCRPDGSCTYGRLSDCSSFVCDVTINELPECDGACNTTCFGDVNGDGVVSVADRGFISANVGATSPELICQYDLDGNGVINVGDRGFVSANIGLCVDLPDYQNGSGMNGGAADIRFGGGAFQGFGVNCEDVTCP